MPLLSSLNVRQFLTIRSRSLRMSPRLAYSSFLIFFCMSFMQIGATMIR